VTSLPDPITPEFLTELANSNQVGSNEIVREALLRAARALLDLAEGKLRAS